MKRLLVIVLLLFQISNIVAQSNHCSSATALTVNSVCSYTAGTSAGATQSIAGCVGNADDDVWFKFVANNTQQVITVNPSAGYDPVVQLFSGSCASLVNLVCKDDGFSGDQEQITATGLTVGATYYIRVYHYWSGSGTGSFSICVQGFNLSTVINDNPCSAIDLGPVTAECNYQHFTTVGATTSSPAVTSGCTNSGDGKGGFGAGTRDVWFKVTVPASGKIAITQQPGYGNISDGVLALYTGTCGSLTQVACDDDGGPNCSSNCLNPSGNNLPVLTQSGLTPGSTVYIRFWAYGTASSGGNFGICVTTATNDNCGNSLYICDLNGYKATTSPLYSIDRPSNMSGTSNGTVPGYPAEPNGYVNSSNKGGPFGLNSCDTGDYRRVTIDNNSWITFTAASTTASLDVTVGDCYRNRGVQFQVFKVTAPCSNFDTVSGIYQNYYLSKDNSKPWCQALALNTFIPTFTVVCRNLVPGQKYYLMVDGFGGDICNYSISAKTGVQAAPVINQIPNSALCRGDSVLLSFNKTLTGAFHYFFTGPNGDTISVPDVDTAIWVKPQTTSNYGLVIEGVCGNKQSTTRTVTVYNELDGGKIAFNGTTKQISLCNGGDPANILGSSTANAIAPSGGSPGWTYSWQYRDNCSGPWIDIPSSNALAYDPPAGLQVNRCYRRIAVNSCGTVISDTVNVTVLQNPSVDMDLKTVCAGNTLALTPLDTTYGSSTTITNYQITGANMAPISGNGTYAPNFNSSSSGSFTYTYTITDGNNCTASDTFSVKVYTGPTLSITPASVELCEGGSVNINASVSGGNSPYSYSWSGSGSSSLDNTQISNPTFNSTAPGNYNLDLQVTDNRGCTVNQTHPVTVNANPLVSITNSSPDVCAGSILNINTSVINNNGAVSYSWTGQTSGLSSTTVANPTYSNSSPGTYSLQVWILDSKSCSDSASLVISVNSNPTISSVVATPLTYCGTNDGVIAITANGSGSLMYSIDGGNNFSSNSTFTGLSDGTYQVVVRDDSVCISNVQSVVVNNGGAPASPTVVTSGQTICEGSVNPTLVASGTGIGLLSWYANYPGSLLGVGNTFTPSTQSVGTNTYYVVEEINGCVSSTSPAAFTVLAAPQNPTFADNDTSVCEGTPLTVVNPNPVPGVVYNVFTNSSLTPPAAGTLNYVIPSVNQSQTLYIQAEQNYGNQTCYAIGQPAIYQINMLTAPAHPTITASSSTICEGESTIISATPLGNDYYLYNSSNQLIGNLSTSVSPVVTSWYFVETFSANGCRALGNRDSILITVNPAPALPNIISSNSVICLGDSSFINVQPLVPGETYPLYALPGNVLVGNAPMFVSPSQTTTYVAEAISANGCRNLGAYDTLTVTVNPLPVMPSFSVQPNATVCAGTQVTISSSALQPGEYVLLFDQPAGGNLLDTLSYSFIATTTVTYYAEIKNAYGCKNFGDKEPITVIVNPLPDKPVIVADPGAICEETSTQITASTNPADAVINWFDTNDPGATPIYTGNTYTTPVLNTTTTYYLQSVSAQGCSNSGGLTSITVIVKPRPIVTLTNDAVNGYVYQGQIVTFIAEPYGYPTYVFYVNNNQVQSSSSNVYQTNSLNNLDVVAVVAIENGCESLNKAELKMDVKPLSNAFTPNNDGVNDVFLKGLDLTILNRWGQQLYKGFDGWDGTYQGKLVSPGTYFYIVSLKDLAGNVTTLNGPVTLIGE